MSWPDDDDDTTDFLEESPKPKKISYPKCYIDKKHDGDPICKECAIELYGKLPAKKFKFPRNCWNCDENGVVVDEDSDNEEPFYEE